MSGLPARLALACIGGFASACGGSRHAEPIVIPTAEGWVSRSRAELVAVWGEPDSTHFDSSGRDVLVYTKLKIESQYAHPDFKGGFSSPIGYGPDRPTQATQPTPLPVGVDEHAIAALTLDPGGVILETWFAEALWRRGIPPPPRRTPPEVND